MIEADFLREYHIDLVQALRDDTFTWRRFFSLLRGLSPQSAYANSLVMDKRKNKGKTKQVIKDVRQAESYLLGLVSKAG